MVGLDYTSAVIVLWEKTAVPVFLFLYCSIIAQVEHYHGDNCVVIFTLYYLNMLESRKAILEENF